MSTLYIMIGPPACGKSTLAKNLTEKFGAITVSSDEVRRELYGDESVQKDHGKVFGLCHDRMCQSLLEGKEVVFDATNLVPKHRINLIDLARTVGGCDLVVGIIYTGTLETCLERNSKRARKVPEGVIRNMYNSLKRFPPSFDEGFDAFTRMDLFADISSYKMTENSLKSMRNLHME